MLKTNSWGKLHQFSTQLAFKLKLLEDGMGVEEWRRQQLRSTKLVLFLIKLCSNICKIKIKSKYHYKKSLNNFQIIFLLTV